MIDDDDNDDDNHDDEVRASEWESVGNNTQMKSLFGGKVVVVAPEDLKRTIIPLFCPLCEFPMLTREDGHAYRKKNSCDRCEMRWGSTQSFLDGSFELVKENSNWKEYIEDRVKRSKQLIKLK